MTRGLEASAETVIHGQVQDAREGRDARVIARVASGWVVFGQQQFLRGYTLLLPDPVVPSLNALGTEARAQFLLDMSRIGDALLRTTGAAHINYAILGNLEPALHAHIMPRYADEPQAMRVEQPWAYDWKQAPPFDATALHELAEQLRGEFTRMGVARAMRYVPGSRSEPGGAA
jgi:diadenosine tetraphosphate (Ap4A) HIT family hydrolase